MIVLTSYETFRNSEYQQFNYLEKLTDALVDYTRFLNNVYEPRGMLFTFNKETKFLELKVTIQETVETPRHNEDEVGSSGSEDSVEVKRKIIIDKINSKIDQSNIQQPFHKTLTKGKGSSLSVNNINNGFRIENGK